MRLAWEAGQRAVGGTLEDSSEVECSEKVKPVRSQGSPRASLRDFQCALLCFICWDSEKRKKKENLAAGWRCTWCELKTGQLPSASRKAMAYPFLSWFAWNDSVGVF